MVFPTQSFLSVTGELASEPPHRPSDVKLLDIYRVMIATRLVDDRMITLQRQGTLSFAMSSLGEEGCSVASSAALSIEDWLYPQYREVGCIFWRGYSIEAYIHHMFCNGKDPILGRQMPNHFGSRELNVVTVSSPIGTKIPHVAGCAYAMKVKKEQTIALCYFGEGATSEGDFHAGLNFAAVKKAPAIFFCRNNQYAISTSCNNQFVSDGIAPKGLGYGIETVRVDGNDVFAVYNAVYEAKQKCLAGKGPILIEAMTYRMGAHSTSDDPSLYRKPGELEEWQGKCPVLRLKRYLEKKGLWDETKEAALIASLQEEITQAIHVAKRTPPPSFETLITDVYKEVPKVLQEQLKEVEIALSNDNGEV